MKKAVWIIIFVFVAIIIAADVSAFIAGASLEWYPTEEQIEKGRILYGILLVPLVIIETFVLTRIFKKK